MESSESISVLIVEDEQDMASMIEMILVRKFSATVEIAEDCASAREKLESQAFDIITLEHQLPDGDGLELLGETQAMDAPPPVIMVTGHGDEQTAVESFKLGASGYVVKDKRLSTLLPGAVEHALSELKLGRIEETLREGEARYRQMFEHMTSGVAVYKVVGDGEDFVFVDFNRAAEEIDKVNRSDVIGKSVLEAFPGVKEFGLFDVFKRVWSTGESEDYPVRLYKDDRIVGWRENHVYKLRSGEIVAIYDDITERKEAEESLDKARDMWKKSFRLVSEGMFIIDKDYNILEANRCFADMLKSSPEKCVGQKCYRLVHGLEEVPETCLSCAAIGEGISVGAEIFEPFLEKHLAVSSSPILDSEGNLEFAVHVARDITERKRAEEALLESERRYHAIADYTYDWEEWAAPHGTFIYVSPSCERITGYSPEEFIEDKNLLVQIAHPQDRENVVRHLREATENDDALSLEFRIIRKDGDERWIGHLCQPIRGEDGRPLGRRGSNRDITKRKMAEEKLQRANVELEGYAHMVSHDLKGLLSGIVLAAETLVELQEGIDTGDAEASDKIVATISRYTWKAQGRIEGHLALAESGQKPMEVSDVDVREVVGEVLHERSGEIKEKGVEMNLIPDLGSVTGSPIQIQQVFSNLIGNAIRHNDSENPIIQVSYLGDDDDGAHRYLVRDNGSGIPEDIIDDVFLPFTRGKDGDTGIGLSIVEKLVNVYGGEIRTYNDNGACFEFTLRDS